ncbi:27838_t:CDS:2, partial [Dentiscutata erythropus]
TSLHKGIKVLNKVILLLTKLDAPWNEVDMQTSNMQSTILKVKAARKTIQKARKLENLAAKRDQINKHIERRYTNFKKNMKSIVNSITKRVKTRVSFDNIITPTEVITDKDKIKRETRDYFKRWTQRNLMNYERWNE